MNKTIRTLILLLLLLLKTLMPAAGAEPVVIENLTRPSMFIVEQGRMFVLEREQVHLYSLPDFKLIRSFGKAGEGPGEFKYQPGNRPLSMCIQGKYLMVNSDHKLSYFDFDGNYVKEEKVPIDKLLFPVNGKYLGIGPTRTNEKKSFMGFSLFDSSFKSEKIVFLNDFEMNNPRNFLLPMSSFTYNPVYKERIYVIANSLEFRINVFDSNGKLSKSLLLDKEKLPIPKSYRTETLEFFKKSPRFKNAYEMLKKILKIREYFPPIRDIQIREDAIYIITFKQKGEQWECVKLDLDGKLLGTRFIPLDKYEPFTLHPILYSVYKGMVYSLVEDEEDETWKIHVTPFK